MICPKCKCEYRDGFYTCSDCLVDLVDISAEQLDNKVEKSRWADVGSLFYSSIRVSSLIIVLEILLFLLLFIIKKFFDITGIISGSFLIALLVNGFIIPTLLLFNNYKLCKLHKINIYLISFLVIIITLILTLITQHIAIANLDRGLIFGYDRRQEVTGGMAMVWVLIHSFYYVVIGSAISQVILFIKIIREKK